MFQKYYLILCLFTVCSNNLLCSDDPSGAPERPKSPIFIHGISRGCYWWGPEHASIDIERLESHATEINQADQYGMTLLHLCCFYRNVPVVKWLVNHGADKSAMNKEGQTPLAFALSIKNNPEGLTGIYSEVELGRGIWNDDNIFNRSGKKQLDEIIGLLKD